jgi:hypothetical protein
VDAGPADEVDAGRYTEDRAPCAAHDPHRTVFWGDLHVHTAFSFDAYIFGTRNRPGDAYRFARGEAVAVGAEMLQLRSPLDFAAVTDHSEFIGEVVRCTAEPDRAGHDTSLCAAYRESDQIRFVEWGFQLTQTRPAYLPGLCDEDDVDCLAARRSAWTRMQEAAEAHYDRSSACSFTTFLGYEWTNNVGGRSEHRNVIFRNGDVPAQPTSYFEAQRPAALWSALERDCTAAGGACDVLTIPHNSNLSNGGLFAPTWDADADLDEQRRQAAARARWEPIVEMFQHKGSSECANGLSGVFGEPDEYCDVEQIRDVSDDCGDGLGALGIAGAGCLSRRDFVRNALVLGLGEEARLGVNPLAFGLMASTDTHNGIPGAAEEAGYLGHMGQEYPTAARLQPLSVTPIGFINNPGGLIGVWSEENSRDALFEAMRRREVFGTSGPRIVPRVFAGPDVPADLCDAGDFVERGDAAGVPMGGVVGAARAPVIAASVLNAPDAEAPLQVLQVVKGWIDGEGDPRYRVFDIAGDRENGADVDLADCSVRGAGAASLCATWTDPTFEPGRPAVYYVRAVQNPVCRWSWRQCMTLPEPERPETCTDPEQPRTIHEMAWTSPIWVRP